MELDESSQRIWSLVHYVYYVLEQQKHIATAPPMCSLNAVAEIMIQCPALQALHAWSRTSKYDTELSQAVHRLAKLAQDPCTDLSTFKYKASACVAPLGGVPKTTSQR